jgi:hypothetical protein
MITSRTAQTLDTGNFIHGCFMVSIGSDFSTFQQILKYSEQDESSGTVGKPGLDPNVANILNSTGSKDGPLPVYMAKRKCRDSSLGGNDSINPLPQFNMDDDLHGGNETHPHLRTMYSQSDGMGQVYSENYDDTQQTLYMGFGIPVFSNIGNFWKNAVDQNMADFVNKGSGITTDKIGFLIGAAPIALIKLATIPFKYIQAMSDTIQKVPITKYYAFSSQMPMYFRFVNTILVMLATNMSIMGSDEDYSTGSDISKTSAIDLNNQGTRTTQDLSGMPTVFKDLGIDMARVMLKRYLYENGTLGTYQNRNTDDAMFAAANANNGDGVAPKTSDSQSTSSTANSTNSFSSDDVEIVDAEGDVTSEPRNWSMQWVDAFKAAYKNTLYDGHLFIGFRIDKGMGAEESFANSTGESQVAQKANEAFTKGKDASYSVMAGKFGDTGLSSVLTDVISGAKGIFQGLASTLKLDPLAAVMSGSAKIDIPDVWMGSSHARSASFTITCLSPYGDMESIFQSEYVPLACILAGALPRGTGYSSHSSPFICQAYCRGVFSSPLCMIESLQVSRGADQFGFTASRLPLKLTMQVTLKDLSPTMYMTMGGQTGLAKAIFGTDDNFGEYMMTLSGMGLRDRLAPFRSMRRKIKILLSTIHKNKLSPYMLGMEGGSRFMVSRVISTIVSGGRGIPGN